MKTEIFVILQYGYMQDDPYYGMADWVEETKGYVFDDYEKARYWVLQWVKEFNGRWKKTERNESGEMVDSSEPVLVEVSKDVWECFAADIEIFRIGEVDIDSIQVTEKVCLS
jgi:hypothetical protein